MDEPVETTAAPSQPRRLSPPEKKALALRKDRRGWWQKYPHAARRAWPRKKALRNQTYRRQVSRSLAPALGSVASGVEDFSPAPARRRLSKWSYRRHPVPLGAWIGVRERKRLWLTGRKLIQNLHKARFRKRLAPYVESLIQGRSERSRMLARSFALILDPPTRNPHALRRLLGDDLTVDVYAWIGVLDDLFVERPDLEVRLRTWIANFVGDEYRRA